MNASLIDRIANLSIFTKFFLLIGAVVFINNFITFLGIYVGASQALAAAIPIESVMSGSGSGSGKYDAYLPKATDPMDGLLTFYLPYFARGFISLVGSLEWLGLAYTIELYFRIAEKMPAYIKGRKARKFAK